jgi:hypothetical protein
VKRTVKIVNVHERELSGSLDRVGALIDSLASSDDRLWPARSWPRVQFDRPLGVGAVGGHGPIRYFVSSYTPGRSIAFEFTGPRGFHGHHGYDVIPSGPSRCRLRHTLEMDTRGPAVLSWPIVFRPLHDALIEDSLAVAEASLGQVPRVRPWPLRVRLLRRVLSGGRARPQRVD